VEVAVPRWKSEQLGGDLTEDIAGNRRALVVRGSVKERSVSVDGALSTAGTVNAGEETVNHVALRELEVD